MMLSEASDSWKESQRVKKRQVEEGIQTENVVKAPMKKEAQ